MKRKPQSLTVHLRHAAHRVHRAAWILNDGATALHCGRVLALPRENTGKVRELFFSDSMALEDKAAASASGRKESRRAHRGRSTVRASQLASLSEQLVSEQGEGRAQDRAGHPASANVQTTLDLYTQEDGDEALAAQGEYLMALGVATAMVQ